MAGNSVFDMQSYTNNGFGSISSILTPGQFLAGGDMSSLTAKLPTISPVDTGVPGMAPVTGNGGGGFFSGMNGVQSVDAVLGGLQSLSNMFLGFQALNQVKKQFKTQRAFSNANLENQVKSYNTALEDRARSRAAVEDQSSTEAQSYIDKNRLNFKRI